MSHLKTKRNVLNWYARLNEMYLHPGKENATLLLISESNINKGDNVLEVGFGVGETICKLAQKYKEAFFYGVEINPIMYSKTENKIKKNGLTNVSIHLIKKNEPLPFTDSFFNLVYAESVLAINETKVISSLLANFFAILKPGGQLIVNDGIWKATLKKKDIEEINLITLKYFGFFQANPDLPFTQNWVKLFEQVGFECKKDINIVAEKTAINYKDKIKRKIIKLIYLNGFKKLSKYSDFLEGHLFVLEKL